MEVKIGIFLCCAVVALMAGVYFIGMESDLFTAKYRLHFTVERGTGFTKGMPIKLSGFRIGRIGNISLNQDARVDIEMQIARKYQQWIRQDSSARLIKESLVGDDIIEINAGSPAKRMLENGDAIRFVKTKTLEEHAAEVADEVKPVLIETRDIVSYINNPEGDFKRSLSNIEGLSRELQGSRTQLSGQLAVTFAHLNQVIAKGGETLDQAQITLRTLENTLQNVDQSVGTLDSRLPQLLETLGGSLTNLQQISADLVAVVHETAPQLSPLLERVDGVIEQTETLVDAVQDIWLIRKHIPPDPSPLLPGDSHE
jgi:phospholipid/cholesterol/gamma-HCH transport system substrate-binding protein